MARAPADFDDWYPEGHARLVAALVSFTGSLDLAAEAVDEACLRCLARWPRVGGQDWTDAWAYRVAINYAKRRLRRMAFERRLLGRSRPDPELAGPAGEIWDAVGRLPLRQRTAVVLRYVADLPEADVARVMKVSRGTVASTLSDARRRLGVALAYEPEKVPHD